jgi:hypothetical protein
VAKRNYYPLATVANKKKYLPLTQHMPVGFTITFAISAYHYQSWLFYAVWGHCQKRIK